MYETGGYHGEMISTLVTKVSPNGNKEDECKYFVWEISLTG